MYRSGEPIRAAQSRHSEACKARVYDILRKEGSLKMAKVAEQGRADVHLPAGSASSSGVPAPPAVVDEPNLGPIPAGALEATAEDVKDIYAQDADAADGLDVDAVLVNPDYVDLFDAMQVLGVQPVQASRCIASVLPRKRTRPCPPQEPQPRGSGGAGPQNIEARRGAMGLSP